MVSESKKIDVRIYIGILFFRWKIIAMCFLYALLAAVIYLHLSTSIYETSCRIMVYRDPNLVIARDTSPWQSLAAHSYLLRSGPLRQRTARTLVAEWGEAMGGIQRMTLPVIVGRERGLANTIVVSVRSPNPAYGVAFLQRLIEEHQAEWHTLQMEASDSAARLLETELVRLEERIRQAEDDLIDYQRLHDIARVEARGSMESQYLRALMGRKNQLTTELMLLEAQFPALRGESAAVISDVARLTRETGIVEPLRDAVDGLGDEGEADAETRVLRALRERQDPDDSETADFMQGWHDSRVRLAQLRTQEADLLRNLAPEHPQVRAVRAEIERIEEQLATLAETQLGRLRDRHKALNIQLRALEAAEYKWQARNLLASQRQAELKRIAGVVERYERNYNTLYARLHDMRVSEELKAEHFRVVDPVGSGARPVWPDPVKILFVALIAGMGGGLGLALVVQTLDNKVQTIADVESDINVPFLGGVPYWVHGDLERSVRPIVTEEHSSGAVEAYRALRTAVLLALAKANEKVVIVTSADAREGKTLTALNLAIMIAQMGKKVLLMDMDLRRGRLHRSLGIERGRGMTDVLNGRMSLREAIVPTRIDNLMLAPSGEPVEHASELLEAANLIDMFGDIRDDYDIIMVDTSPVLRVTDTVVIAAQHIGVVLCVARVNKTPIPMIRYAIEMLRDARILGLIMNSIEMNRISSLYYAYQYPNYAYYSNAYAYGSNYYYGGENNGDGLRTRRGPSLRLRLKAWGRELRRTFLPME